MLSRTSRTLTYVCAVLYLVLGGLLFFQPVALAPVFAWKVTAFMTMTIGGWCIGNAWLAYISARRWTWGVVRTSLIYLWLFGFFESYVLIAFREKIQPGHPVAWLYMLTLGINLLTAVLGVYDWYKLRPARESFAESSPWWMRWAVVGFVVLVAGLGLYGVFAQVGWPFTEGQIFPEIMSLFTLRSFGFFYTALALAPIPLIWEKGLRPLLHHALAAYALIVFITAAAFVYLPLFDFSAKPFGLAYFGAYLIVGIPLLFVFMMYRKYLAA